MGSMEAISMDFKRKYLSCIMTAAFVGYIASSTSLFKE